MQRIWKRSSKAGDSSRRLTWSVSVVAPAISKAKAVSRSQLVPGARRISAWGRGIGKLRRIIVHVARAHNDRRPGTRQYRPHGVRPAPAIFLSHCVPVPARAIKKWEAGRPCSIVCPNRPNSCKLSAVEYDSITSEGQLREFCGGLADCPWIALDTEFVSEGSYRPELCLIQVATPERLAVIDAIETRRRRGPSGRRSSRATRRRSSTPAAARWSSAWPRWGGCPNCSSTCSLPPGWRASSIRPVTARLVYKLLGESMQKHETRTDWRKRPLSKRQLDYAAEDVYYLSLVRDRIHARLAELGRLDWLAEERQSWCEALCRAMSDERWRRVSGNSGLDPRSLAIVHELWKWREEEARRRDQPVRRVLRDDLIIELAKRQTADVKRIRAVRGMERGDLARRLDQIASCIQRALACRRRSVRRGIRGRRRRSFPCWGSSSLPPWAASAARPTWRRISSAGPTTFATGSAGGWRAATAGKSRHVPKLASGWRAEFVGRLFDDLLSGKTAVRIGDPAAEHPLILERHDG